MNPLEGTPVELRQQNISEDTVPLISIACVTFNHGAFIEKCLEGFLRQKTTFPVEIIVHDDASSDDTANILRRYQANYPNLIRPIFQTENQLSKIGGRIVLNATNKAQGELIAYCEGDDVWTDESKLQTQAEYLAENLDCAGCFHRTRWIDTEDQLIKPDYFIGTQSKYDFRDCLTSLGSAYASCSLVFRKKVLENPPDWFKRRLSDMFLELQIARFGKIGYLDKNMADYRRHGGGNWSQMDVRAQALELIHRFQLLLEEPEFSAHYGEELRQKIADFSGMLILKGNYDELDQERNSLISKSNHLEKTVTEMRNSLSWRITGILRFGLDYLKQTLRKLDRGRGSVKKAA